MSDAALGILIEYVYSGKLNGDLNGIACSDLGTGRNTSDEVLILVLKTGGNEDFGHTQQ